MRPVPFSQDPLVLRCALTAAAVASVAPRVLSFIPPFVHPHTGEMIAGR